MGRAFAFAGLVGFSALLVLGVAVRADGPPTIDELPLSLALAAASEAVAACETGGYHVSVTVIGALDGNCAKAGFARIAAELL